MVWLTFSAMLALIYACLQLFYWHFWRKIPVILSPNNYSPSNGISVIIVVHNEEESIGNCINSIVQQNAIPSDFELIIVDDRSNDGTLKKVREKERPGLRIIQLTDFPDFIHPPAFKKSGIQLGVHLAKHDRIVVTDADCTFGNNWLQTVSYAFDKYDPVFIASPVLMPGPQQGIKVFQQIENLSLMAITGAGIQSGVHEIANGANMAFLKRAFKEVDGYAGNYDHASGDDMFLIEKMRKKYPDRIMFLKSRQAAAFTKPKQTWSSLISQRIRWAGKNSALSNKIIKYIWLFVGIYHAVLAATFIGGLFHYHALIGFAILLMAKTGSDYLLVQSSASFFRIPVTVGNFVSSQLWYFVYMSVMGWNLMTGAKGDWDGTYSTSGA